MRIATLGGALTLALALVPSLAPPPAAAGAPIACDRLPAAPRGLPWPVELDGRCGRLVVRPDGTSDAVPREPVRPSAPGSVVGPDAGLVVRQRHVVLLRAGREAWRSYGRFRRWRHDGAYWMVATSAAMGDGGVAFVVSRWAGKPPREDLSLYVAPLDGRERLVARDERIVAWTPRGLLTNAVARGRLTLRLRRADGRLAARPLRLRSRVWTWDERAGEIVALLGGSVLARSDGVHVRRLRSLASLGFRPDAVALYPLPGRRLQVSDERRVVVLGPDGAVLASLRFPRGWLPGMVAESPTGSAWAIATARGAYRPDGSRREVLYLLASGQAPRRIATYTGQVSCAGGTQVSWTGSWLLVASDGRDAFAIDTARPRRQIDLTPLVTAVRTPLRPVRTAWLRLPSARAALGVSA